MREYMITLGSVMMMVSISGILIPDGGIKKFASLAMGFMVITAAVFPIGREGNFFSFPPDTFGVQEEKIQESSDLYKEAVLNKHRENLEEMIKEHIKHGSVVKININSVGDVEGITLHLKGDESLAVNYIVNTLNIPRERIKMVYEYN